MKKLKLKGFVLPTLYFIITLGIFVGVMLIGKNLMFEPSDYDYGVGALKGDVRPVVKEDTEEDILINTPVSLEEAELKIHFYSKDATEDEQKNSLIYYENTYIPNTGVLYTADNSFSVKTVYAGKVSEILDDEFFGKCIVIEHQDNLRSYYYGLKDIEVSIGDEVTNNTVLGKSNNNTIMNDKNTFLLEIYYNNVLINPEKFIGQKITNFN